MWCIFYLHLHPLIFYVMVIFSYRSRPCIESGAIFLFSFSWHPPDIPYSIEQQTSTDTNRHRQTYSNSTCQCLGVSFGVCWHVAFPGEALGVPGGCLEVSEWHSWKSEALECVWGYLGSHSLQYGAKTLFWHNPKKKDFFHLTIPDTLEYQNGRM